MPKTKFVRWMPLDPVPLDNTRELARDAYKVYCMYTDLIETVNKIMDLCIYWESSQPCMNQKNPAANQNQKNKKTPAETAGFYLIYLLTVLNFTI